MAKSQYSWSEHNEYYRKDSRGRVTTLKRLPYPKAFAKAVIEARPAWIERPDKAKAKK